MSNNKTIRLSKSQYVKGRQCYKKIWLYNHKKELMDEVSGFQEKIFEQGNEVGELACTCFENGKLVDAKYNETDLALEQTKKFMEDESVRAIFEAAFIYDDILRKNDDGSFDLIEVKSSTDLKKINKLDIAVQKYVLEGCKLKVKNSYLMHVNNEYIKDGDIDLQKFFTLKYMDEKIKEELLLAPGYVENIKKVIKMDTCPSADIGSVCKSPYQCEFKGHCWGELPATSIHYLDRVTDKKRAFYLENGWEDIKDIPLDFDFPKGLDLTNNQRIQSKCEQEDYTHIELKNINEYLDSLEYPLYHLDFETSPDAIPVHDGYRPYQHYVFQYSLHVQESIGAECKHIECLDDGSHKPRDLMDHLLDNLGSKGSIVTYNQSFEAGKLKDFQKMFPDRHDELEAAILRIVDLADPFQKRWFFQKEFLGKYSIKNVLPAMVQSLSYKGMKVSKGDQAVAGYAKLKTLEKGSSEYKELYQAMLDYCALDSLAMAKILEELKNIVK